MSRFFAAALIAIHLVLVVHGGTRHSAAFDEVAYPASGYAYLTTGDYRMNAEHPPFLKLWTGLGWLGTGLKAEGQPGWDLGDQWAFGAAMIYGGAYPHNALLLRARAMIALLSAALAMGVFVVARRLSGEGAGLAALALYAFDPLVVAHAGFATTDLGAAAFYFFAAVLIPAAVLRGGAIRIAGAGLLLGLALASKFSTLPLVLIPAVTAAIGPWASPQGKKSSLIFPARAALVAALAAGVAAVTYGPQGPALYLKGLGMLRQHGSVGHPSYAFGFRGSEGWWWYFPAAWAVKTPIPVLLASVAGIAHLARRLRWEPVEAGVLLLGPVLVLAPAMAFSLDLGVRHLLPMTPFLAVAGGSAAAAIAARGRAGRALVAGALLWLAAGTLHVHPDEMAYANEAAGGPQRLWRLLSDSNVDWGQDLPALAAEIGRYPLRRLYLGYFGTADPRAYGIRYTWISSMRMIERRYEDGPDPGGREWLALSVTILQDVYHDRAVYSWLRDRPFTAFPGHTIALFDITGDALTHRRLGETAIAYGDARTAEPPFRRAVELAPADGLARLGLAKTLVALGRSGEAERECREAERLLPTAETSSVCGDVAR